MPEGITVDLVPDPAGIDSLTRQIRQTGRAYPLFDIAHLILKRPDRYHLHFGASGNNPDGSPRQFFVCNLDDTVWLSENEAVRHILNRHFGTFYQTEKIAVEPPKGTYTFVAQCGISGVILGPPNLHDYQTKLQKLHAERFSRMSFDMYKSRVRIVRDEAVVKQWVEEQSFKFEFTALNLPEPLKLPSREAVEQHFRQTHLPNIVQAHATYTVRSAPGRDSLPPPLRRLARREFDLQQRFPLKIVTRLSDDFAHRGLHFFKVNRTVLHVAVARPRYLDLETNPVGEGIRRIVTTIQTTPACTRRKLLETLGISLAPPAPAPAPVPASSQAPSPAPAAETTAPAEPATEPATEASAETTPPPTDAPTAAGDSSSTEAAAPAATPEPAPAPAPAPAAAPAAAPVEEAPPSPELQAIVTDLHWLIHEGHVIEFANGVLEVAKKPAPKPTPVPRPPRRQEPKDTAPAVPATGEGAAAAEAPVAAEGAPEATPPAPAEAAATESITPTTETAPVEAAPAASTDAAITAPATEVAPAAPAPEPAAPAPEDDTKINPS